MGVGRASHKTATLQRHVVRYVGVGSCGGVGGDGDRNEHHLVPRIAFSTVFPQSVDEGADVVERVCIVGAGIGGNVGCHVVWQVSLLEECEHRVSWHHEH